jgi:hypothetical protein
MFKSLVDGLGAAVGGIAFSVLPSFVQQYLSGLSTCEIELARIANDGTARPGVMTPEFLAEMQTRAVWCADAAQAIDGAIGLRRIIAFAQNFDPDIARATLRVFQPALQVTLDGLYFFLAGVVVGLLIVNILMFPFRAFTRRRAKGWR